MTRASQIVDTQFYTYLHSIFGNLRPFRNRLISASPFISHSEHTDSLLLFAITDTSSSSATQHSFLVRILSSQSCMSSIAALFQSLSTRMLIVSQKPECAMWGISGVSRIDFFQRLNGRPTQPGLIDNLRIRSEKEAHQTPGVVRVMSRRLARSHAALWRATPEPAVEVILMTHCKWKRHDEAVLWFSFHWLLPRIAALPPLRTPRGVGGVQYDTYGVARKRLNTESETSRN